MTLTDAWKELGVEAGADAETVRRAYLRLIKTRKPESDPVGFQRAREAYEIARVSGDLESIAAGGSRRPHEAVFADKPPTAASATEEPAAPASRDRPQADVIFEGFSSAWNSVPASADQRQRLEIAREAVAVLPDDPRAHWLLVTTLSRLGPDNALADALRAGWRAGWPEFLEALLVRLPGRATREEIDAGFALRDPAARLAAAAAIVGWDPGRAATLVVELCKEAMEAPMDARGDHVRDLPIPRMLDVILALHAAGALEPAAEAQGALRGCLQESGLELALVHGPLGGVWTLTEEIGGLPPNFPAPLRAAFAISTRSGDLSSAFIDTSRAIERDRGEVRRWATHIAPTAPNVAGIMRTALSREAAGAVQRTGFQVSRLSYLAIPVLLAVVRMCATSTEHSYTSTAPIVDVTTRGLVPSRPGLRLPLDRDGLERAAAAVCGVDGSRHGQLVCADVEALVTALNAQDCNESRQRLATVKRVLRDEPAQAPEARFINQAVIAQWGSCGGMKQGETGTDP